MAPYRKIARKSLPWLILGYVFNSLVFFAQILFLILCLPAFFDVNRNIDNLALFYNYLLFLPLIAGIILSLCVRFLRPLSIFCTLVIALVIVLPFARDYWRNDIQGTKTAAFDLKVATFNALYSNTSLMPMNAWLRTSQPDVIALQEISDAQAFNVGTLSDLYPFTTGAAPLMLVSRFPIVTQKRFMTPDGNRDIIYARFRTPKGDLDVYALHADTVRTDAQWQRRNEYLSLAAAVVIPRGKPILVMGDFNATPWNRPYTELSSATNLHTEPRFFPPVTRVLTRYAGKPIGSAIDHILINDKNRLSRCRTQPPMESDHLAVMCHAAIDWSAYEPK